MRNTFLGLAAVAALSAIAITFQASQQPDVMHIERSVLIQASPQDVFPFANDYANRGDWDPWRERDPNQTITTSEQTAGVGAWMTWEGNDDVGKGKLAITESVENERVVADLAFLAPWESSAVTTLTLTPEEDHTRVTWSFDSEQALTDKMFTMFMDMDAALGPDFQHGLDKLKVAAETVATERKATEAAEAQARATEDAGDGTPLPE